MGALRDMASLSGDPGCLVSMFLAPGEVMASKY